MIPNLDDQFLAWLAGFWEGEGSFSIHHDEKNRLHTTFSVAQQRKYPLEYIKDRLRKGGLFSEAIKDKHGTKTDRLCWQFKMGNKVDVIEIFEGLMPYLIFRKTEVEEKLSIVKTYLENGGYRYWTEEEILELIKVAKTKPWKVIARDFRRTEGACQRRYYMERNAIRAI